MLDNPGPKGRGTHASEYYTSTQASSDLVWKPLNHEQLSTMERITMCEINITLSNILRYTGRFMRLLYAWRPH